MIHYKYILIWASIFLIFIALSALLLSFFLPKPATAVDYKISGNPANHEEVITFVLPYETDECLMDQTSCPEDSYLRGYRAWLDPHTMAVLNIQFKDLDVVSSHCEIYTEDFTADNGINHYACSTTDLSRVMYYMPEELKNLIQ